LATGVIDVDQARVVVHAVQTLPQDAVAAEPGLPVRAEAHLLDLAQKYDAKKLKALARHLMEVLDPDGAEERLGNQLEAEEAKAARAASLELRDNGDGTHTGRFKIGTLHAAMLKKALDAILNPARNATGTSGIGAGAGAGGESADGDPATGQAAKQSRPEQYGHAFGELLERFPADRLPTTGGVSATVVITLDYDALLSGLGTATLDTGEKISAGLARRLACEDGVIPAVIRRLVDGRSVVLDMGRERRLHTKHMRIALGIEQGGCTAVGCERPPGWCDAHHDLPWIPDGPTSVENGRLLCRYHHHRAHDTTYDMTRLPDGTVRFHKRT
jgi:hypothetical protein